jgi:hypothetical protein
MIEERGEVHSRKRPDHRHFDDLFTPLHALHMRSQDPMGVSPSPEEQLKVTAATDSRIARFIKVSESPQ